MKILLLHSDFIEFEAVKKAIKQPEEIEEKKHRIEECLVVFSSVEKRDEGKEKQTAELAAKEIEKVSEQVKCKNIVLYPYVHLSNEPSKPSSAIKVLNQLEELLKKDFKVQHSPFGWYKKFNISVKGHPLSELSREIVAIPGTAKKEDEISGAIKEEEKVKSEWFVLEPNGKLTKVDKFDFKNHESLEKFYKYEKEKAREDKKTPAHVKYMKTLELADNEPGSDSGNLRFFPKGRLVKGLLEEWISKKISDYGAMEVETPIMYDFEHPALKDYLERFPARQYIVESVKKTYFLRFSACFGQFLTKANSIISYKNLPLKMYELTRYSFRLEKRGELSGLRRQRAFTMPDMHTLCKDFDSAKQEFANQFELSMSCLEDLGLERKDYETALRFTKELWKNNKDFSTSMAKLVNKPVLIEVWSKRFAYFDPKFEFNFIDTMGKAGALSTVQIDHENAKRYGIQFTDIDNKRKYPFILHCSPSGGLERCMWALIEKAVKNQKNPMFPLWLSPTQIRLCPINDSFTDYCKEIADQLEKENIRVDIDDKQETIDKKIMNSEKDWNPFTIVIGQKEKDSGKLAVRFRETGKVKQMEQKELIKLIKKETQNLPFKKLPLPRLLSKRPIFFG